MQQTEAIDQQKHTEQTEAIDPVKKYQFSNHAASDEKGRFVFIRCKIYNNRLALVSIYGPNETDSAFLTQISKTLLEEIDCPLVVGGDFNAVINPALDKSQSDTTAAIHLNYWINLSLSST